MTTSNNRKTLLERLLNLFAEVRAGEAGNTLLLALSIFLIFTAYYIAKVVREPLILAGGGAELKSYSAGLQAVTLILFIGAYSRMAASLNRRKLLNYVTLFFVAGFAAFYFMGAAHVPYLGVVYFVWIGVFNLTIVAQFWSFANDIHTPDEGRRLFAIIAFGGPLGAVVGTMLVGILIDFIGIYQLLLVSGTLLFSSLLLVNLVESRRRTSRQSSCTTVDSSIDAEPIGRSGAFRVVFKNRYLLLIALMILMTNWVNTTGGYMLDKVVSDAAQEAAMMSGQTGAAGLEFQEAYIGKFFAKFLFGVNVICLLIQLFLVSWLIKWFGIRTAIMVLPVIALGGYLLIAAVPILSLIRIAKTAENATDYSLNNTARQMLFLPTTREEKYKAKVAIDSFFVRFGDVLSAGVIFVGGTWLAFGLKEFALVNLALVVIWLVLAIMTGRENRRLMAETNPIA